MAHRPYPDRQRALRQLDRHHHMTTSPEITPLQASIRGALIVMGEVAAPILRSLDPLRPPRLEGWRQA